MHVTWKTYAAQHMHFEVERFTKIFTHSLFNSSTQSRTFLKMVIYTVCIYFKCTSQSLAQPLLYSLLCFKLKLITVCLH